MAQLAFVYSMAKPREKVEKVTIKEPVHDPKVMITGRVHSNAGKVRGGGGGGGGRGFPHRFFAGSKTKTIELGVQFTGPETGRDETETEKAKSRSLESSPEKGEAPAAAMRRRKTVDDDALSAMRAGSYHWLRRQKSGGAYMERINSLDSQPTVNSSKKVSFPDMKKSASWAHFVEVSSQVQALPHLDLEVPEQYACDMSALFLGQKFASGNHSRLYQGVYNDQDVAVKLLRLDCCEEPAIVKRLERQFMQEVHCLSQLHHPNIVKFVAASWKPPVCCLIMEYAPGGSLRAFLRKIDRRSMPMKTVLSMALDVALGMEYLHSQGIMHRDLKSENLVLTEDLHLKLTDFGVGCLETECDLRSADTGTFRWMAPEMISHKRYSKKVDVYSFGIVLWELVTGLLPFQHMTPVQVAYAVVNKNLRPSVPDDCPSPLRYLMEDCWVANPECRPNFYQIVHTLEDLDKSWTEQPYHQQYARSILFGCD